MRIPLLFFFFTFMLGTKNVAQDKYILDSLNNVIDSTTSDLTKAKNLIELSTYYWYIDTDSCIMYVDLALEIINSQNESNIDFQKEIANAENSLGVSNYIKGNYTSALIHFEKSFDIATLIKDSSRIASSRNNMGHIYRRLKDFDRALDSYEQAYNFFIYNNQLSNAAVALQNIGNIHSKEERFDVALLKYKKCVSIFDSLKDFNRKLISEYNIGLTYYNLDSIDIAESSLLESKFNADSTNNIFASGSISMTLGEVYLKQRKFKLALTTFKEALRILSEVKATSRIHGVYIGLSKTYDELKQIDSAYHYFKKYHFLRDSLTTEETIDEIATMRSKFNYEREIYADSIIHQQEKAEQRLKIDSQNDQIEKDSFIQMVLGFGITVFLLVAILAFRAYSQKNKANEIVHRQKLIVEEKNKEITDSIQYAKRIQTAILPPNKIIEEQLPNSFILYKPKDIVAGDFYWLERIDKTTLFAAADCTGHGGAWSYGVSNLQ